MGIAKKTLISLLSINQSAFGVCPKCKSMLRVVYGVFGTYMVCSNPLCGFCKKIKFNQMDGGGNHER